MQNQDGIIIRQMRLKVLYTFDSESKTTCLARWPHLLDIQTAYLDQDTQVGVIELRTCIQAIVSASPELVARLSNDYTIYAYDYSEYETPLVGQGMLSWILAAASSTPDAPAHQSKTIVTGRVCKNVGPFSRGAQETLEVRLKLVPVPTSLQTEYNSSMAKYRDSANALCSEFDIERWASFVQQSGNGNGNGNANGSSTAGEQFQRQSYRQTPTAITDGYTSERERCSSPSARSGIEHFQAMLTECATPRDLGSMSQVSEGFRAGSPALSVNNIGTPRGRPASPAVSSARPSSRAQLPQQLPPASAPQSQQQQQQSYQQPYQQPYQQQHQQQPPLQLQTPPPPPQQQPFQPQPQPQLQQQPHQPSSGKRNRGSRPNSRANSISHNAPAAQFFNNAGHGNCTSASGYDSSDEAPETSAPKRAKLTKPERPNLNIEKQRTSLLKAASNAASVRIHRPRPTKPGMDGQVICTGEDLIRPPTPVPKGPLNPRNFGNGRRGAAATRLGRQSSLASSAFSMSAATAAAADDAASSSEDARENGTPETPLNMPSSPPVFENMYPQTSSPGLPPLPLPVPDYDSGFMSGGVEGAMSDDCNQGNNAGNGVVQQQLQQQQQQQQNQGQQGQVFKSSKLNETYNAQQGKFVPILPAAPSAVPTSDAVEPQTTPAVAPPLAAVPAPAVQGVAAGTAQQQLSQHQQPFQQQLQPQQQQFTQVIQQYPITAPSQQGDISRPSSRASYRHRPIAPAPPLGSQPPSCPTTDPVASPTFHVRTPLTASQKYDFPVQVPATSLAEASRIKSGAKRTKQVKNRLNQCIKEGSMPPYCQNCGAIETPTWRRAWYKVIEGNEDAAKSISNDVGALFWEPVDKDDDGQMTSFKQFKKSLAPQDTKFTQLCLCNPCGLYLYKMEKMRPENMWNKSAQKDKRKKNKTRPPLRALPLANGIATVKPPLLPLPLPLPALKPLAPSPDPESSPTRSPDLGNGEEQMTASVAESTEVNGAKKTTEGGNGNGSASDGDGEKTTQEQREQQSAEQETSIGTTNDTTTTTTTTSAAAAETAAAEESCNPPKQPQSPNKKRANSEQPPSSAEKRARMNQDSAREALRKAIQASPARNLASGGDRTKIAQQDDQDLTPKPVCRNLFPDATTTASSSNSNTTTPKASALGVSCANIVRDGPEQQQQQQQQQQEESGGGGGDSTMQFMQAADGKENEYPSLVERIDHFFSSHSTVALDLALPVTPTRAQPLPQQEQQAR
ncbi:hypothetical protein KEM56_006746, partial [Ascosphaera pollenicola]